MSVKFLIVYLICRSRTDTKYQCAGPDLDLDLGPWACRRQQRRLRSQ